MWDYIVTALDKNYMYLIQQVFAIGIFLFPLKLRKDRFWLRLIPSIIAYLCVVFFLPDWTQSSSYKSILIFAVTAVCIWIPFEVSFKRAVFSCVGAYMVLSFTMFVRLFVSRYIKVSPNMWQWIKKLLTLGFMALLYPIAYFVFAKRCRNEEIFTGSGLRLTIISVIAIGCTSMINIFLEQIKILSTMEGMITSLCGQALGIFVLASSFDRDKKVYECKMVEQILHEEHKRHELSKENIDIINMKCHDIKHQIAAINNGGVGSEKLAAFLKEAENAIVIYDSAIQTGNETLDIILMEKNLLCEKRGIKLTYIIDAEKLNFMETMDIYSLFGNALENAIESVMKEDDTEKRIISINVSAKDCLLNIYLENYCAMPPLLEDGLPVTTKEDKSVHGYGVRSIQRIVRKYNGNLIFRIEDNFFKLSVMLPTENN